MKTAFVCLSDYIAPEPLQLIIIILIYCGNFPITGTQDFLFAMAARFGYGSKGSDVGCGVLPVINRHAIPKDRHPF